MKRTTYKATTHQCQAITLKKKRCTRDAVAIHAGKSYCNRHHEKLLAGIKAHNELITLKEKVLNDMCGVTELMLGEKK